MLMGDPFQGSSKILLKELILAIRKGGIIMLKLEIKPTRRDYNISTKLNKRNRLLLPTHG